MHEQSSSSTANRRLRAFLIHYSAVALDDGWRLPKSPFFFNMQFYNLLRCSFLLFHAFVFSLSICCRCCYFYKEPDWLRCLVHPPQWCLRLRSSIDSCLHCFRHHIKRITLNNAIEHTCKIRSINDRYYCDKFVKTQKSGKRKTYLCIPKTILIHLHKNRRLIFLQHRTLIEHWCTTTSRDTATHDNIILWRLFKYSGVSFIVVSRPTPGFLPMCCSYS
jgi:hypothetical protein